MSVLETFFILFKSNAEDLKKGAKEAEKTTKDLQKSLDKTKDTTDELGKSFVKIVEGATAAVASYLSLSALKSGILNVAEFNSQLQIQGKVTGQNTEDILAYGAAFQAAGSSVSAFNSFLQNANQIAQAAGVPFANVKGLIDTIRGEVHGHGFTLGQQANILSQRYGIVDLAQQKFFEQSDEDYKKAIENAYQYAQVTIKDQEAARAFEEQLSNLGVSFNSVFTTVGTDVLPIISVMAKTLSDFAVWLRDNRAVVYGFFAGLAVVAWAAVAPILAANAALLATVAGIGLAVAGIYKIGEGLGLIKGSPSSGGAGSSLSGNAKESLDFWLSQGYTRAQAAGLVANEQRESGFNPNAVGDNGTARGSFQWHADRRRSILAATGIDIDNASHIDQLKAAAWELHNRGDDARVRGTSTPEDAAAAVSQYFERPGNAGGEAATRAALARGIYNNSTLGDISGAQGALGAAGASPFSSGTSGNWGNGGKTISLKTGDINIQTQATDANGIAKSIGESLQSHFRATVGNFDDGING